MINNDIERLYDEKTTRHNLSTKLNLWCSYRIRKMAFKMTNSEKGRKQEDESQDWHPQAPGWSRRITYLTDEEVERKMLVLKEMESCSKQISERSTGMSDRKETDQGSSESPMKEGLKEQFMKEREAMKEDTTNTDERDAEKERRERKE